VQKKDRNQRRLHLRGCLWSRDRCLVSSLGPRTVNLPFPPSLTMFSSCRNLSGIQFKTGGCYLWTSAFPTRLSSRCGMGRWSSTVTACASGVRAIRYLQSKMGKQRAAYVAIISSPNYLLLILVGWFPNNGQRLTRIQNRTQEDVSTLWVRHWWCHTSMTGSGGFTPGTPVSTHKKDLIQKENKEKENFTLF